MKKAAFIIIIVISVCEIVFPLLHPSQEATDKDLQDRASETDANMRACLADAYMHPIFHSFQEVELGEVKVQSTASEHLEGELPSHNVQRYEVGQPGDLFHYEYEQSHNIYH